MTISNSLNINFLNNQLLYANSSSTLTGLTVVNNAGLLTGGTGTPNWVAYTGTGAPVLATSPTLVTPLLGTPTSGTLTNCTGLPLTTGITGILPSANGGTGINNGASTITLAGSLSTIGAFTSAFTMTGNTTVTFPTTGTLATTATASGIVNPGLINQIAYYAAAGSTISGLTATANGTLITGAAGIPSIAALANGTILIGTAGAPAASTTTWPATSTINQILYSSAANTITGLSTSASGVLITSAGGVPSISSTLPTAVQSNITTLGTLVSELITSQSSSSVTILATFTGAQGVGAGSKLQLIQDSGAAMASGNQLGIVQFGGASDAAHTTNAAASIRALATQNWTAAHLGSQLTFYTNPNNSTTQTLALTINQDQSAIFASTVSATSYSGIWAGSIIDFAHGGTNANLTANNGGIIWSNATQMQILAGTAIAGQLLLSGATATPSWSTTTYPATNAINTLLYASSANIMSALATGNNGVLITSGAGVPSISSTLPSAVQGNITATGALASGSLAAGFTPVTVPIGGTGLSTATAYAVLCGGTTATGAFQSIASVGTTGQVLTSNGAGALPTFQSGPASQVGRLLSFQILTAGTAATYTKPAGITSILVECIGGGGGGAGCAGVIGQYALAGGGGSGGYCRRWITGASATYTYTIGGGGAGAAPGNNAGITGSATTFSGGTMSAGGGIGAPAGSSAATGNAALGGAGGASSGGDINFSGFIGGGGFGAGNLACGGSGASSVYGGGAAPVSAASSSANGNNATANNTGAGGGGAAISNVNASGAGGNGGSGIIVVWEFT